MAVRPEARRRAVARNDALALARLSAALRSHEHGGTFLSRTGGIVKLTKIPLSERRKEISQLRSGWSAEKIYAARHGGMVRIFSGVPPGHRIYVSEYARTMPDPWKGAKN